jgi:hypothetical protein
MPASIAFLAETEDDAEQFVREYVLDAVDRAPEVDGCEGVAFSLNEAPNPKGEGSVGMTVLGESDAFLENEEPKWREYQDAGVVQEWNVQRRSREQFRAAFGENGGEITERLMPLAERMAAVVYDEFDNLDDLPEAVDTFPEESLNVGGWVVPHHIAYASLDYSAAEEISMHKAGIEEDLKLLAEYEGEETVDEQLDSLLADLEAMREEVKKGRTRFEEG